MTPWPIMWGLPGAWLPAEAEKFLASSAPWAWALGSCRVVPVIIRYHSSRGEGWHHIGQSEASTADIRPMRGELVTLSAINIDVSPALPGWLVIRDQDSSELHSSDTSSAWIQNRLSSTFKVSQVGIDYLNLHAQIILLKHSLQLAI